MDEPLYSISYVKYIQYIFLLQASNQNIVSSKIKKIRKQITQIKPQWTFNESPCDGDRISHESRSIGLSEDMLGPQVSRADSSIMLQFMQNRSGYLILMTEFGKHGGIIISYCFLL